MSLINAKKLDKERSALHRYLKSRNLRNVDVDLILNDYLQVAHSLFLMEHTEEKIKEVKKNANTTTRTRRKKKRV